jgi:hypothetical protein
MGNPWLTEAERQQFSAPNKAERRQNRNPKRSADLGNFPKRPERSSRENSPALAEMRRTQDFVAVALSRIGGSRVSTAEVAAPDDMVVRSGGELKPLTRAQLALRKEQREARAARLAAGDAAYQASEAARREEKRRLESIIKAAERRLRQL